MEIARNILEQQWRNENFLEISILIGIQLEFCRLLTKGEIT